MPSLIKLIFNGISCRYNPLINALRLSHQTFYHFKSLCDHLRHFKHIQKQNTVKQNVIKTAGKLLSSKKILNFHKGKSITKSKKTNFETLKKASAQHQEELMDAGLVIDSKGRFVNA